MWHSFSPSYGLIVVVNLCYDDDDDDDSNNIFRAIVNIFILNSYLQKLWIGLMDWT